MRFDDTMLKSSWLWFFSWTLRYA